MKVSTEYGATKTLLNTVEQTTNNKNTRWSCEKAVSFIIAATTIICVLGYIFYAHMPASGLKNKNEVQWIYTGAETQEHRAHGYDFDLSVMTSAVTITDCADGDDISYDGQYGQYTYQEDIQAIANAVVNNWDEFEEIMMKSTHDDAFISCFHTQMRAGNIVCAMECDHDTHHVKSNTIQICEDESLDLLNEQMRPNRRSCIFKELAFEFSDLCDDTSSHSDRIANAAFKWYKAKYDGSKNWRTTDCP